MRKLSTMMISAVVVTAPCFGREPLEIKGDHMGEPAAQFILHYPDATCENMAPDVKQCTQNLDVTVAGAMTHDKEQCQHPINNYWHDVCLMQGVSASFYKGQLTNLSYNLPVGVASDVCRAFTQKYGKPDHEDKDKEVCAWWVHDSDGKFVQFLTIYARHAKVGGQPSDSVLIQLSSAVPSKDI